MRLVDRHCMRACAPVFESLNPVRDQSAEATRHALLRVFAAVLRRFTAGFAVACLACQAIAIPAAFGAAAAEPVPPLPLDLRLEPVIDNGAIEGHKVMIARFRSARPATVVLDALRRDWAPDRPRIELTSAGWLILSILDAGVMRSVQLRAAQQGGTEGVYSAWRLDDSSGSRGFATALLPASVTPVRRVSSGEGGTTTETLVAVSTVAPDVLSAELHARLLAHGYVADATPQPGPGSAAGLYHRRGSEVAFTVIARGRHSDLVIHHTGAFR